MGISPESFRAMDLRNEINKRKWGHAPKPEGADEGPESALHDKISKWCEDNRLPVIHSRMDKRATTAKGTPDFQIGLPNGRSLYVECKKKGGKQTTEQRGFEIMALANNHAYLLCYSFESFLATATKQDT